MKERIIYLLKVGLNEEIECHNLNDLNNTLEELEKCFLKSIENEILVKEIKKEEYISYRNELGISVKGKVKNYTIKEDLLEYILRLNMLEKSVKSVWAEGKDNTEIETPFYFKKIKVCKYFLEDILFEVQVSIEIHKNIDNEV